MNHYYDDERVRDGRWVSEMVGPEGKRVRTWVRLPIRLSQVDHIVRRHTAFKDMRAMQTALGGYNPTIECSNRSRYIMAECYDMLQELRGDDRRAHRYVNGAMLAANMAECEVRANFQNTNPYGTNDSMEVWSNQALRAATVLAVDDDLILVEYEMPRGSTALLQYRVKGGQLREMKNINYNTCPKHWLANMRANDMDWIGMGQRMTKPLPFPTLLRDTYAKPGMCEYMLKCTSPAVTTVPNPILGPVPCCQSCADFYNK
jgi:hypothetical protein